MIKGAFWQTANFHHHEFRCACCNGGQMDMDFILRLQKARTHARTPFRIISGWRCAAHNKAVGGVMGSSHLRGYAADIQTLTSEERFAVVRGLILARFQRIGIGDTFVHVDDDPEKIQRLIWRY